ncbi:MAG: VanW family protein [Bacillota bacterium]|nr:VanW family protein [Bacillota bacterium]
MKKIIFFLISFLLIIGIFIGISYSTYNNLVNVDTIYRGISINGVDVSNLTMAQALEKLSQEDKIPEKNLDLVYEDFKFSYPYEELGYKLDYGDAVLQAYIYGRDGSPGQRFLAVSKLTTNPIDIEVKGTFAQAEVERVLGDLENMISRPPEDATFAVVDGQKKITEAVEGLDINKAKTKDLIYQAIESEEPVAIAVDKKPASLYASAFESLKGPIGSFQTDYSSSILNRKKNIQRAAEILNGTIINPHEQISFNNLIGDISEETGFFPATVINDGDFDTGVGGGICQVSTTFYNAAVAADLNIDERRNHSRPVGYVPLGTDAAIAIGYLDLKITNPFDFPIYVGAEADDKIIRFTLIGDTDIKNYDVDLLVEKVQDIKSETIRRDNPAMEKGQEEVSQKGYDGSIYQSYKVKKDKEGNIIDQDKFYRSTYPARNTIIDIGSKAEEDQIVE